MDQRSPGRSITRRTMLKRIGAGTAIAWSAPILTSLRTPAFAQYGEVCELCGCLNEPGALVCGQTPSGDDCVCARTSDRARCVCVQNDTIAPCEAGDTCPAGQICVCLTDTDATWCVPLCGPV